jgi:hypothetical protein
MHRRPSSLLQPPAALEAWVDDAASVDDTPTSPTPPAESPPADTGPHRPLRVQHSLFHPYKKPVVFFDYPSYIGALLLPVVPVLLLLFRFRLRIQV